MKQILSEAIINVDLPSKADIEKIVKAYVSYEPNKSDSGWCKRHFMQTPWGIGWNVSPKGKAASEEAALKYYIISLIIDWDELSQQLKRTLKMSYKYSAATFTKAVENTVLKNTQALVSQTQAVCADIKAEMDNNSGKLIDSLLKKPKFLNTMTEAVGTIEKTTPYMLRNDGVLLACGDVHPYIKMFYKDDFNTNLNKLLDRPSFLVWFYQNTLLEETRSLIAEFAYAANLVDLIGQLKLEKPDNSDRPINVIFKELNDITNQEFCRVRTSNFKYKYGGDNGEIYFRISSVGFNWFDLIWMVVNQYKSQIKYVTIMKDYATTGEQFAYIKDGEHEFNKMPIEEFLTLSGNPVVEELEDDLAEDIEKHDSLNPALFEDDKLKPEVRDKLITIVNEFVEGLEEDKVPIQVADILLIGSNASYNYTKDSDIDLHIIVDTRNLPENELYPQLYNAYKSLWNSRFDITVAGIPVELYVETEDSSRISNGSYSVLNNTWAKEPVANDIPELNKEAFEAELAKWEDRYNQIMSNNEDTEKQLQESLTESLGLSGARSIITDQLRGEWEAIQNYNKAIELLLTDDDQYDDIAKLLTDITDEEKQHVGELQVALETIDNNTNIKIDEGKDEAEEKMANPLKGELKESLNEEIHTPEIDEINSFIDDLYELRKNGLANGGEYSIENQVFKEIRNKGYLDNLKARKVELMNKELSLESLKKAADELDEAVLKEDLEFGEYKDKFIRAILSQDATALHKGAESRKIYNRQTGELEDKLLWDSVLHHIDGNHENNPFDFSNYTLIQCDNYSTAMLIHRLIHLLSFAENGNAAEDIKNKIRRYDAEFITLIDNRLSIQDFDSWWKDHGHIILNSATDKIANMQPGKKIVLEDLNEAAEPMSIQDAVLVSMKHFESIGIEPEVDEVIEDIAANVPGYEDWQDIAPDDMTRLKGIRFEVTKAMNEYFKESLEQTVEQDLADNRQPVDNTEEEVLEEPYDYKYEIAKAKGLAEDTEKVKDHKWVNRGENGTHGEFKTKKEADAQRKAMFANGYKG